MNPAAFRNFGNGRGAYVWPMTFGKFRIIEGEIGSAFIDRNW